jgi:hypothetical protein
VFSLISSLPSSLSADVLSVFVRMIRKRLSNTPAPQAEPVLRRRDETTPGRAGQVITREASNGQVQISIAVEIRSGQEPRQLAHCENQLRLKSAIAVAQQHRDRTNSIVDHGNISFPIVVEVSDDDPTGSLPTV